MDCNWTFAPPRPSRPHPGPGRAPARPRPGPGRAPAGAGPQPTGLQPASFQLAGPQPAGPRLRPGLGRAAMAMARPMSVQTLSLHSLVGEGPRNPMVKFRTFFPRPTDEGQDRGTWGGIPGGTERPSVELCVMVAGKAAHESKPWSWHPDIREFRSGCSGGAHYSYLQLRKPPPSSPGGPQIY